MHSLFKKRGQGATVPLIIGLVISLVTLFVIFSIYGYAQTSALNVETVTQTGCWLSNTVKCGEGFFSFWPSLCAIDVKEEPVTKKEVAKMIRDTWWMYKGQSECDFGNIGDEIFPVYAFEPAEDIAIIDLLDHMRTHNRGRPVTKATKSDYNYIEQGSKLYTLCFDMHDKEGIAQGKLAADADPYYMFYYDDQELVEFGYQSLTLEYKSDAILISTNPSFDKSYFKSMIDIGVAGVYGVGVGTIAGTLGVVSGGALIVPTIVIGTGGYAFYKHTTDDDVGCLIYGPTTTGVFDEATSE
jgi:hypothetical protein